jgi:cellulose biosynthesis protein BcsQ
VLASSLSARVAFGEANAAGLGVVDYAPGSPAALEAEALVREVVGRLGKGRR